VFEVPRGWEADVEPNGVWLPGSLPARKTASSATKADQLLHRAEAQPPSFHSAVKDISPFIGGVGQGPVFVGIEPITKFGFASRARSMRSYFATLA
jgi:hypothetical protein